MLRGYEALLYRTLTTLRVDAQTTADVDELAWTGPRPEFEAWPGMMDDARRR
jgi:hypothetical protein